LPHLQLHLVVLCQVVQQAVLFTQLLPEFLHFPLVLVHHPIFFALTLFYATQRRETSENNLQAALHDHRAWGMLPRFI